MDVCGSDCEDLHGGENVPSMLGSRTVLSVKTLFISSEILDGKSPFFYKVISMKVDDQIEVN